MYRYAYSLFKQKRKDDISNWKEAVELLIKDLPPVKTPNIKNSDEFPSL